MSCSSGSRRNRAGERMRLNAMSACATTNTSLRRSDSATSRSSATLLPADHAAPTREPTLGERLEHTDVGEPLHAAAAEHQCEAGVLLHENRPLARNVKSRVT